MTTLITIIVPTLHLGTDGRRYRIQRSTAKLLKSPWRSVVEKEEQQYEQKGQDHVGDTHSNS